MNQKLIQIRCSKTICILFQVKIVKHHNLCTYDSFLNLLNDDFQTTVLLMSVTFKSHSCKVDLVWCVCLTNMTGLLNIPFYSNPVLQEIYSLLTQLQNLSHCLVPELKNVTQCRIHSNKGHCSFFFNSWVGRGNLSFPK